MQLQLKEPVIAPIKPAGDTGQISAPQSSPGTTKPVPKQPTDAAVPVVVPVIVPSAVPASAPASAPGG